MKLDKHDIEEKLDLDDESISSLTDLEINETEIVRGSSSENSIEELSLAEIYSKILSGLSTEIDAYSANNKIMTDEIKDKFQYYSIVIENIKNSLMSFIEIYSPKVKNES